MGRLVRIPDSGISKSGTVESDGLSSTVPNARPPANDAYLDRIAKYIPGEVLAFFIVINAILSQVVHASGKGALMAGIPVMAVAVAVLIFCTILVPLFVWYVHEEGDAWEINAAVSMAAFPFWAYALGATAFVDHWDGNLAAIMLVMFTVVSGLIAPRRGPPARREDLASVPAAQPAPAPSRPERPQRPQLDLVGL
jgi:hypothetical protein